MLTRTAALVLATFLSLVPVATAQNIAVFFGEPILTRWMGG